MTHHLLRDQDPTQDDQLIVKETWGGQSATVLNLHKDALQEFADGSGVAALK